MQKLAILVMDFIFFAAYHKLHEIFCCEICHFCLRNRRFRPKIRGCNLYAIYLIWSNGSGPYHMGHMNKNSHFHGNFFMVPKWPNTVTQVILSQFLIRLPRVFSTQYNIVRIIRNDGLVSE